MSHTGVLRFRNLERKGTTGKHEIDVRALGFYESLQPFWGSLKIPIVDLDVTNILPPKDVYCDYMNMTFLTPNFRENWRRGSEESIWMFLIPLHWGEAALLLGVITVLSTGC